MYLCIGSVTIEAPLRALELCAARLPHDNAGRHACENACDAGIRAWVDANPTKMRVPTWAYDATARIDVSLADAVAIRAAFDEGR